MPIVDFVLRLPAALVLAACVGLQRQWRQRMAGTRTNALVSAGASAFVMCAFMVRIHRVAKRRSVGWTVHPQVLE
jgi:putative Mg2+ transporter-C (MgtC) family protein